MNTAEIGCRGEEEARRYLVGAGFDILATNWRSGRYELDIIAARQGVIHFVEVKCRKDNGLTTPEDAITPSKFNALRRAAEMFLAQRRLECEVRFDLIAVRHSAGGWKAEYYPDAMYCSW